MNNPQELIAKVELVKKENPLDLSQGEDLAMAVMNLVSLEEHLFFTAQKTGKSEYFNLLNRIRVIRIESMKHLIPDPEGEVWCTGKHLLAASMRLMEVGTKNLKLGKVDQARKWFDNSFEVFTMFWELFTPKSPPEKKTGEKSGISKWLSNALDCCKE